MKNQILFSLKNRKNIINLSINVVIEVIKVKKVYSFIKQEIKLNSITLQGEQILSF